MRTLSAALFVSACLLSAVLYHGLLAIAVAITLSAEPVTGGADEHLSRVYSVTRWPDFVRQIGDVLDGEAE